MRVRSDEKSETNAPEKNYSMEEYWQRSLIRYAFRVPCEIFERPEVRPLPQEFMNWVSADRGRHDSE